MTANRTITIPATLSFARGRGAARTKTAYPTEKMTDSALCALLQYGTRYLNDTANGSKKDDWSMLHGETLVRTFLDWLASPRVRTASASAPSPAEAEAIKEYLSAKRTNPVWKKAEATHWVRKDDSKTRPMPKSLETLREYLAVINKLTVFPADKWAGIESTLKTNIAAIEARRAELAEEGEEADLLL